MAIQSLPGGVSAFGLPYSVYNATSFSGWNNTSGTGGAGAGISGPFGMPVFQQNTSPQLLSAQQDALQSTINNGLGNLTASGVFSLQSISNSFSNWFSNIASVNTSSAAALTQAVNKSAKGCSGFLSCLFG